MFKPESKFIAKKHPYMSLLLLDTFPCLGQVREKSPIDLGKLEYVTSHRTVRP